MHRTLLLALISILAMAGVADSWYLFQSAVQGTALACDIGAGLDGCNTVAQSAYSRLFDIPLGLYGVGFFGLMLAASIALLSFPSKGLYAALLIASVVGAVASVIFLFIQAFLIQAFCIYCALSAAIAFSLFWLAYVLWKRFGVPR